MRGVLIATMTVGMALLSACGDRDAAQGPDRGAALPAEVFLDAAAAAGLDFVHYTGATGEFFFPEIMGAGGALFDYDADGDLDVLLIQGRMLDPGGAAAALFPEPARHWPGHRLFRNDLNPGGGLKFTDVTAESGILTKHYGMGVAVGDIDNDADPDLYITGFGDNHLFRNNGNGTFSDITDVAGTNDPRWSTSASFFDMDGDGDLDLYVANYVRFSLGNNIRCTLIAGQRDYCTPETFPSHRDSLFRNEGLGRFSDVSAQSGIAGARGPGLGVLAADFNGDRRIDIYVANDKKANFLWLNQGKGRFIDAALMSGAAYNRSGNPEASMGVTAADFDGDGDEDLFMTHLASETNTLYLNDGSGQFEDVTDRFGLGGGSLPYTGFGSAWFDVDNDGRLDLFVANGGVLAEASQSGERWPYNQKNQLFLNTGKRFVDVSAGAGKAMQRSEVGRGAAFGDVDNDGDVDVLVTNNSGPARLLLNEAAGSNHWLSARLTGRASSREAAGARVGLVGPDGKITWRRAHRDGSYLSASDIRVHFGLGAVDSVGFIVVEWPDGRREKWPVGEVDREMNLIAGAGEPWAEEP